MKNVWGFKITQGDTTIIINNKRGCIHEHDRILKLVDMMLHDSIKRPIKIGWESGK